MALSRPDGDPASDLGVGLQSHDPLEIVLLRVRESDGQPVKPLKGDVGAAILGCFTLLGLHNIHYRAQHGSASV